MALSVDCQSSPDLASAASHHGQLLGIYAEPLEEFEEL